MSFSGIPLPAHTANLQEDTEKHLSEKKMQLSAKQLFSH